MAKFLCITLALCAVASASPILSTNAAAANSHAPSDGTVDVDALVNAATGLAPETIATNTANPSRGAVNIASDIAAQSSNAGLVNTILNAGRGIASGFQGGASRLGFAQPTRGRGPKSGLDLDLDVNLDLASNLGASVPSNILSRKTDAVDVAVDLDSPDATAFLLETISALVHILSSSSVGTIDLSTLPATTAALGGLNGFD